MHLAGVRAYHVALASFNVPSAAPRALRAPNNSADGETVMSMSAEGVPTCRFYCFGAGQRTFANVKRGSVHALMVRRTTRSYKLTRSYLAHRSSSEVESC